ncbi:MAG: hypothetical protein AB2768_09660 [Candidatus Thiodiazotropha endolucinida]
MSSEENPPGQGVAEQLCSTLGGEGPYLRGDYGWEWIYRGHDYKALAVLQQYEAGWLIPVEVGRMDRLLKRGASVLDDLSRSIDQALGQRVTRLLTFPSEQAFRTSGL